MDVASRPKSQPIISLRNCGPVGLFSSCGSARVSWRERRFSSGQVSNNWHELKDGELQ